MSDTERLAAICTGASPRCGIVFGAYKNRHMCGKPLAHVGRHRCGTCGTEKHNDMLPAINPPARLFLAGPMTGFPSYNFPAFYETAKFLREAGYQVWSPAEEAVKLDKFDPVKEKALPLRHYLRRSMAAMYSESHPIDAVAVMEGWPVSNGTRLEMWAAYSCDIMVVDAHTIQEVDMTNFVGVAPALADLVSRDHVKNVCEFLGCSPDQIMPRLNGFSKVLGILNITGSVRDRLRALRESIWSVRLDEALSLEANNALDEAAIAISAAEFDLFKAERTRA